MLVEATALLLLATIRNDPDDIRRRHACQTFLEELRDIGPDRGRRREALGRFGSQMAKLGCLPNGEGPPPASTVKATQASFGYRLRGHRIVYRAPEPLILREKPPRSTLPPEELAAVEQASTAEVQEILITAILIPDVPTCEGPATGWVGLVDTNDPDSTVRRVQFDSSPPVYSSAPRNTVPDIGDRVEFSSQFPAQVFASQTPCYSNDPCGGKPGAGAFRVVTRVSFPAGPRGYLRWQLCVVPTVKTS
jgi:hypothetical protein